MFAKIVQIRAKQTSTGFIMLNHCCKLSAHVFQLNIHSCPLVPWAEMIQTSLQQISYCTLNSVWVLGWSEEYCTLQLAEEFTVIDHNMIEYFLFSFRLSWLCWMWSCVIFKWMVVYSGCDVCKLVNAISNCTRPGLHNYDFSPQDVQLPRPYECICGDVSRLPRFSVWIVSCDGLYHWAVLDLYVYTTDPDICITTFRSDYKTMIQCNLYLRCRKPFYVLR